MAPYLHIPQTPVDKTKFEEEVTDLVSISEQSTPTRTRRMLEPPDAFHRISIGSFTGETGVLSPASFRPYSPGPDGTQQQYSGQLPQSPPKTGFRLFWARHRPVLFVFFAQLFGSLMNLAARLLELEKEDALHPFQLLFIRMVMTTIVSMAYMYRAKVPHFPFGPPAVRWLLVARGFTGFFGIFGMWFSMMYLPLAEATVITFLAPSVLAYICHVLLKDRFTRKEQIASVLAFIGVLLITRPLSLFTALAPNASAAAGKLANATAESVASLTSDGASMATLSTTAEAGAEAAETAGAGIAKIVERMASAAVEAVVNGTATADADAASAHLQPTPTQRLIAIGVALLGVLGTSFAFTTIRAIGPRAHPLISVNYFSTCCLIITTTVLTLAPLLDVGQPALRVALPHSLRQWVLVTFVCMCGFLTQLFSTKGLGAERSNRATAMMYTQMLFAAFFDRFVFGNEMGLVSLIGCGLIIGSALWVALTQKPAGEKPRTADIEAGNTEAVELELGTAPGSGISSHEIPTRYIPSEAVPMLASEDEDDSESVQSERTREVTSRQT